MSSGYVKQPQRAMCYVKAHFSVDRYETAYNSLWTALWNAEPGSDELFDVSKPDILGRFLGKTFSEAEVQAIVKGSSAPEAKATLTANTQKAVELGAYGAPFMMVRNGAGLQEPFFGSDRFHFMWEFLGLPVQHVSIKEKSNL